MHLGPGSDIQAFFKFELYGLSGPLLAYMIPLVLTWAGGYVVPLSDFIHDHVSFCTPVRRWQGCR